MILEVIATSLEDCIKIEELGADRIELNQAFSLGGLTPSIGLLKIAKERVKLPIVAMLRNRGGGFYYTSYEYDTMKYDLNELLKAGADGVVFGFLNDYSAVDVIRTKEVVDIIHSFGKEAVFSRAYDVSNGVDNNMEALISCGVDRVLTSGHKKSAIDGIEELKYINEKYGKSIKILAGSGVNHENAKLIANSTGITELHSSCKGYMTDLSSVGEDVSYDYIDGELGLYEAVDEMKLKKLVWEFR